MPIPGDLTSVTVTGQFATAAGAPVTGRVTFTPDSTLLDPTSQMVFPAAGACYPLSSTGTFTSDPLIATDNEDLEPQGWLYVVKVELQDLQPYTFTCALPSAPSTVDISALEPVYVSVGSAPLAPVGSGAYLPTGGGTETGTLVLDATPPLVVPGATAGQILVSDGSGNFTVQNNTSGSATSIDGLPISGTIAAGRTIIVGSGGTTAVWQLPLQLDFANGDVQPLGATALASASYTSGPGLTQAAVADHVHPFTGVAQTANNLSDLASAATARTNLGLGTAATYGSVIQVGQGGTGSGTQNFVDLSTTQTVAGAKTFSGAVAVSGAGASLTVPTPTSAGNAVTKAYADSVAVGLSIQAAAVAATVGTETFTISAGTVTQIAGTTLDTSVSPAIGNYVLIKDAPAATGTGSPGSSEPGNGLYQVTGNTTNLSVSRAAGMSGGNTPVAGFVFVEGGTVNAGSGWVVTTPAAGSWTSYGSGNIQWTQFSGGGGVTVGTGLTQAGSVISLAHPVAVGNGGTGLGGAGTAGQTLTTSPSSGLAWANAPVDWLNVVTAYGADSSGVSDATTAIGNALTAATAGQTVYLPAGTYLLNTSAFLTLATAGIRLTGDGPKATYIKIGASFTGAQAVYLNAEGCAVENLSFTAASTTTTSNPAADAIYINGQRYSRVSNVEFEYINGWCAEAIASGSSACYASMLTNLSAYKNCAGGIHIKSVSAASWAAQMFLSNINMQQAGVGSGANANLDAFRFEDCFDIAASNFNASVSDASTGSTLNIIGKCATLFFTGMDLGSYPNASSSTNAVITIQDGSNGSPTDIRFATGVGQQGQNGLVISGGASNCSFTSFRFFNNYGSGARLTGTGNTLRFLGCTWASNGQGGVANSGTYYDLEVTSTATGIVSDSTYSTAVVSVGANGVQNAVAIPTAGQAFPHFLTDFRGSGTPSVPFTHAPSVSVRQDTSPPQWNGNLAISGTATVGAFKMASGATSGDVLTSDGSGNGTWAPASGSLTFDNLGTVTTSQSLATANGNVQELTLGASIAVSAITGPGGTVACDLTLYIKQDSTGGRTITSWPGSVTWLGGSAPVLQAAANAVTVLTFESLNGGTGWYGAQITGAPSLPVDIALGGTGATDSNDALAALAGPGVLSIFGNGNDGAVTFDGTTTILGMAPVATVYTLTRDIMCTSITVNAGVTVRTSSASGTFRIFCQGTVTLVTGSPGGTITAAGNAASGATGGAVLNAGSLVGGRAGGGGGAAGTGAGTAGGGAFFGVAGGAGGAGGDAGGTGGAGGAATISGTNAVTNIFNTPFPVLTGICGYSGDTLGIGFGAGGGGGGGATGDAGGGGGGGGGIVAIFAYNVIINSGATITAAGGAGHAGAGGNAAGGGGGSGGLIFACTLTGWTVTGTTVVTGGAAGAASGSSTAATAGGAGNVVNLVLTS